VARDRKRSKQRGPRTDRAARGPDRPSDHAADPGPELSRAEDHPTDEAPEPLDHGSAEVDIADAQLAVGRPELADEHGDPDLSADDEGGRAPDELQEGIAVAGTGREARRQRRLAQMRSREPEPEQEPGAGDEPVDDLDASAEAAAPPRRGKDGISPDELRPAEGPRVIAFLQASWRELQRVQWPDRQQVAQATGVVLVFVVIAGLYLGLTGELASRLIKAIL
jgi:preprotein translocase subunit SecE